MAYALETKKRKFDRILESLTEGSAGQSRTSLNSRNNSEGLVVENAPSDASKKRRVTPSLISNISKSASTSSLTGHYLPSSRTAFLERLETYRGVTMWHVPSTEPINASAWSKRGWTCIESDTVFCGSCKERQHIDLELESSVPQSEEKEEDVESDDQYTMAKEIYEGMIKRYQEMIITSHAQSCPWRKRGCDSSIQRIEGLLNVSNAVSSLESRYESIVLNAEELADVLPLPETSHTHDQDLEKFGLEGQHTIVTNALRLAICGWQRKWDDVLECKHCFRSLGLWLYRGKDPAVEKLDAVESHLEYCPWRSPDSQDTEVNTIEQGEAGRKQVTERLPGWILVYQAVAKTNARKKLPSTSTSAPSTQSDFNQPDSQSLLPEQREKKLRDLIKRIKEIKKPFNVKALLRKRDKPKA